MSANDRQEPAGEVWKLPDGRTFTVREPYYPASCDGCNWVGSSEECGTDHWGDDSDVFCPKCYRSGADIGKLAEQAVQSKSAR